MYKGLVRFCDLDFLYKVTVGLHSINGGYMLSLKDINYIACSNFLHPIHILLVPAKKIYLKYSWIQS